MKDRVNPNLPPPASSPPRRKRKDRGQCSDYIKTQMNLQQTNRDILEINKGDTAPTSKSETTRLTLKILVY